jgi:hypothetical protein
MNIADRFALFYKPIQSETDIVAILSMMKLFFCGFTIITLILFLILYLSGALTPFSVYTKMSIPIMITPFIAYLLTAYSLPSSKSRLLSGIMVFFFLKGIFFVFVDLKFSILLSNWLTVLASLLSPLLLLIMLMGAWLAFRSIQATFIYHRMKRSKINLKSLFKIPVIFTLCITFIIMIFVVTSKILERLEHTSLIYTKEAIPWILPLSVIILYFIIIKNPIVSYAGIDESAESPQPLTS